MPKIILKFPKYKLTAKISLADILGLKELLDRVFNIDWEEIGDKRMDRERD